MANCHKCGKGFIRKRKDGYFKCKRCGILPKGEKYMSDLLWWGYRHTSGTLQAKRYLAPIDIQEAHDSPFVKTVHGPFKALGRDEALAILEQHV